MTNDQKILIDILNKSIKNQKMYKKDLENVNYNTLIKEVRDHNISSLVYYTLHKDIISEIDSDIIEEWKKEVFFSNMIQIKHINQINHVLKKFNEQGIEVLVLKGLVLRNLYLKSEFRSMSDADILVKNHDFNAAEQCLYEIGYVSNSHDNDIHKGFTKLGALEIEMHNKLVNKDFVDVDFSKYESELWDNSEDVYIGDVKAKTLGKEDFIIHLILHMAVHTKLYGFGIRQLYDLALFIKQDYKKINWNIVEEKLLSYGFLRYTQGIMMTINKLFHISIPENFHNEHISEKSLDLLIDSIMQSGVHGKKELNEDFKMLYESSNHHKDESVIFKRIVRFILPKSSYMMIRYGDNDESTRRNIYFIPALWIDRIVNQYVKKYGFIETITLINLSINILKRRNKVVKVFDLPY